MSEGKAFVGLVGLYDDPDGLIRAARQVRDAGYRKWDCHTPYPVHGLDAAMGLKRSPVSKICLTSGFVGLAAALWMQWWMSAADYPVVIGGKEFFSWPAFVPITFELFVLFSGLAITGSLIWFCKLWRWHSPLHDTDVMKEVTCDRFAIVLDAVDERFSEKEGWDLLENSGCGDIRRLYENRG